MGIDQFGWWTLGMSFTADGSVHYFARPGVEPLTAADHLTSQYPYSFRAVRFRTFFFNVCNKDDGYSWSTPFVIDDPELYVVHANRVNTLVARKIQQAEQRAAAQQQAQQRAQQRAAARQQGQQGRSR
jgi:hypothetical protein